MGWEGGIGDEEQAIEAEETGTDPAAALAVVKGLDLAHGAVEAHPWREMMRRGWASGQYQCCLTCGILSTIREG